MSVCSFYIMHVSVILCSFLYGLMPHKQLSTSTNAFVRKHTNLHVLHCSQRFIIVIEHVFWGVSKFVSGCVLLCGASRVEFPVKERERCEVQLLLRSLSIFVADTYDRVCFHTSLDRSCCTIALFCMDPHHGNFLC